MRRNILIVCLVCLSVFSLQLFADEDHFRLNLHYNHPAELDQTRVDRNLSCGLSYRFWGIFYFQADTYFTLEYGADNLFNIRRIIPVDLFSAGFGLDIPMGDIHLILDGQQFYTGFFNDDPCTAYCDSFKIGLLFYFNNDVALSIYSMNLYDFADLSTLIDEHMVYGMGAVIDL